MDAILTPKSPLLISQILPLVCAGAHFYARKSAGEFSDNFEVIVNTHARANRGKAKKPEMKTDR